MPTHNLIIIDCRKKEEIQVMYSAAMTLGVNNGEERLNNLYCMGADAKINKAEILN